MNTSSRLLLAVLAACTAIAAQADNDAVDRDLAALNAQTAAREACTNAARDRGIDVRKVERVRPQENGPIAVRLATGTRGDIDCDYDATTKTATLLGLPATGNDLDRSPLVKICEKVADQQDIRLGRFDELKPLDGRRVEVRFDRAFLGKRHSCVVDQAKNLVSFDGGKAVPLPGTSPSKK
jgi:hypothetical protein